MKHDMTPAAVALGTFDGLHLGHMAVIRAALAASGTTPEALLFDTHPLEALRGQAPPALLTAAQRLDMLEALGVRGVTVRFAEIRDMSPETFVRAILRDRLGASRVFCGGNYRFGRGGAGTAETLTALCAREGIAVSTVPAVLWGGALISSTRIREALSRGDVPEANAMLGRRFGYAFPVAHGDARGHSLGFPTANQHFPAGFCIPRHGVYASTATVGGRLYPAMTNIGVRPTVDGTRARSETHIFGFSGDLYGISVPVALLRFVRDERRFDSLDALIRQMTCDRAVCEQICKEEGVCL